MPRDSHYLPLSKETLLNRIKNFCRYSVTVIIIIIIIIVIIIIIIIIIVIIIIIIIIIIRLLSVDSSRYSCVIIKSFHISFQPVLIEQIVFIGIYVQ